MDSGLPERCSGTPSFRLWTYPGLQTRHTQAVVAVANNASNPENIARAIGDPVYQRPFSGQYWQIENLDGDLLVSQSLVDGLLPLADETFEGVITRTVTTSDGEELLCMGQWLTMDDGQTIGAYYVYVERV